MLLQTPKKRVRGGYQGCHGEATPMPKSVYLWEKICKPCEKSLTPSSKKEGAIYIMLTVHERSHLSYLEQVNPHIICHRDLYDARGTYEWRVLSGSGLVMSPRSRGRT